MGWLRRALTDPDIRRRLLREEGEVIVDEVRHHGIVYALPDRGDRRGVGARRAQSGPFVDLDLAWFPFALALAGILTHAAWARPLRAHGPLRDHEHEGSSGCTGSCPSSSPRCRLSRILDITVKKPLHGRIMGFGHFVFESAAQEQGLRDIRFVGRPDDRDLAIQRVVQRVGSARPARHQLRRGRWTSASSSWC